MSHIINYSQLYFNTSSNNGGLQSLLTLFNTGVIIFFSEHFRIRFQFTFMYKIIIKKSCKRVFLVYKWIEK